MEEKTEYLKGKYMTIIPFEDTKVGDVLWFCEFDNENLLIFNKRILTGPNGIPSEMYKRENMPVLRKISSSINYEAILEEEYKVKLNKKLIEKYNLNSGYNIQIQNKHLICNPIYQNKKTR